MGDVLDWLDLCPQTICWQPVTGRDAYGKPVWGSTAISGFAGTAGTLTFSYTGAQLAAGAMLALLGFSGAAAGLNGQPVTVLAAGLSPTQFEAQVQGTGYASGPGSGVAAFPGRRSFKQSRVASYERGTKGQGPENISESQVWILGLPAVGYEDLIFVSGDVIQNAQGQYVVPPILSIGQVPDEDGPLFSKIYLGSSNG